MNLSTHATLSDQIDKASTLTEAIRSRLEEGTVNKVLAELLTDILLVIAEQIDNAVANPANRI